MTIYPCRLGSVIFCLFVVVYSLFTLGCGTMASLRPQDAGSTSGKMSGLPEVYKYPKHVVFEQARQAVGELGFTIKETGRNQSYFIAKRTVKLGEIAVVGHGELLGAYFKEHGPASTLVTINSKRQIAVNVFAKDFSQALHDEITRRLQALRELNQQPEPVDRAKDWYRLTVNTTPTDSTIMIMNIVPQYRHGIGLQPGKYDILVRHPGYKTFRQWVELRDGDLTFDVNLEKKSARPGSGPDRVPPPIGTPASDPSDLRVDRKAPESDQTSPNEEGATKQTSDSGGNPTRAPAEPTSTPRVTYKLIVHAVPPASTIQLLNTEVPYQPGIELPVGRYDLLVTQDGYKPLRRWVTIGGGDVNLEITLEKLP